MDTDDQVLLRALRDELIPMARSTRSKPVVLFQPPLQVPPSIRVEYKRAPALKVKPQRMTHPLSYMYASAWPDVGLKAMTFPYMCWVVEGEADLRIGVTRQMLDGNHQLQNACGHYTVSLLQGSFGFVPPGTPFSDGSTPHWHRAHLESASSRIFWLQVLPAGAYCHICTTRGSSHIGTTRLFIRDVSLDALATLVAQELRAPATHSPEIVRSHSLALLLRVERSLAAGKPLATGAPAESASDETAQQELCNRSALIMRACQFIRAHYAEPLSPAIVARQAYTSTSQLVRLFRTELDMTVMEFVVRCRLDTAKSLLQNTELPIHEVSRLVGYRHVSHFSTAFGTYVGLSPRAFRNRVRLQNAPSNIGQEIKSRSK